LFAGNLLIIKGAVKRIIICDFFSFFLDITKIAFEMDMRVNLIVVRLYIGAQNQKIPVVYNRR